MHHIAIMNKSWKLIPKIVSGEKSIESRWYQTRRAPWNGIEAGDTVFFKNSGEDIIASAAVSKVLQFELKSLDDARQVVAKYGKQICIVNPDPETWQNRPRYCILIFLKDPRMLNKPFAIDKKGFGNAAAWLTITDIRKIKI